MKVDTLQHLIEWVAAIHEQLATRLEITARHAPEGPAKWFADYAAQHERRMAEEIAGCIEQGDSRALGTWVYDWLTHAPQSPTDVRVPSAISPDLGEVGQTVFSLHETINVTLQSLQPRADTAEVTELLQRVIDLESGHGRQMAQQHNRISDM